MHKEWSVGGELEATVARLMTVGARVSALLVFAPFFGSTSIAPRVKVGLAVALTALLYPVIGPTVPAISGAAAWKVAAGEFVVGLMMGLVMQFVFEGLELAGQIAGFQVGHSLANLINPQSNVDTPILANFYQLVALLIFFQLDVHRWLLRALAKSFEYCPPGLVVVTPAAAAQMWRAAGGMLIIAVQVAIPILVATMMIDVVLGLLGRASPQLPVLFVGMPIKNCVALFLAMCMLRFWPELLERYFGEALATSERMMHLAH